MPDPLSLEWRCPKCSKPSREDKQAGWRICAMSNCRHRFAQATVTPVEVIPEFSVPRYPCPKCGKESREHVNGKRICSLCRFVF